MKHIIQFESETGQKVLVEVEGENEGIIPASRRGDQVIEANLKFEQALNGIKTVAEAALNKLVGLSQKPSKIEVEFGINLSATAGAVVASAALEANYKVTLTWETETVQPQ